MQSQRENTSVGSAPRARIAEGYGESDGQGFVYRKVRVSKLKDAAKPLGELVSFGIRKQVREFVLANCLVPSGSRIASKTGSSNEMSVGKRADTSISNAEEIGGRSVLVILNCKAPVKGSELNSSTSSKLCTSIFYSTSTYSELLESVSSHYGLEPDGYVMYAFTSKTGSFQKVSASAQPDETLPVYVCPLGVSPYGVFGLDGATVDGQVGEDGLAGEDGLKTDSNQNDPSVAVSGADPNRAMPLVPDTRVIAKQLLHDGSSEFNVADLPLQGWPALRDFLVDRCKPRSSHAFAKYKGPDARSAVIILCLSVLICVLTGVSMYLRAPFSGAFEAAYNLNSLLVTGFPADGANGVKFGSSAVGFFDGTQGGVGTFNITRAVEYLNVTGGVILSAAGDVYGSASSIGSSYASSSMRIRVQLSATSACTRSGLSSSVIASCPDSTYQKADWASAAAGGTSPVTVPDYGPTVIAIDNPGYTFCQDTVLSCGTPPLWSTAGVYPGTGFQIDCTSWTCLSSALTPLQAIPFANTGDQVRLVGLQWTGFDFWREKYIQYSVFVESQIGGSAYGSLQARTFDAGFNATYNQTVAFYLDMARFAGILLLIGKLFSKLFVRDAIGLESKARRDKGSAGSRKVESTNQIQAVTASPVSEGTKEFQGSTDDLGRGDNASPPRRDASSDPGALKAKRVHLEKSDSNEKTNLDEKKGLDEKKDLDGKKDLVVASPKGRRKLSFFNGEGYGLVAFLIEAFIILVCLGAVPAGRIFLSHMYVSDASVASVSQYDATLLATTYVPSFAIEAVGLCFLTARTVNFHVTSVFSPGVGMLLTTVTEFLASLQGFMYIMGFVLIGLTVVGYCLLQDSLFGFSSFLKSLETIVTMIGTVKPLLTYAQAPLVSSSDWTVVGMYALYVVAIAGGLYPFVVGVMAVSSYKAKLLHADIFYSDMVSKQYARVESLAARTLKFLFSSAVNSADLSSRAIRSGLNQAYAGITTGADKVTKKVIGGKSTGKSKQRKRVKIATATGTSATGAASGGTRASGESRPLNRM